MKPLIYVVEDDSNIQNVIKISLENSQFKVICFDQADGLFDMLNKTKPDLIILDIMLPGMSGLDALKKIKKIKRTQKLPVLIVSAKSTELDRVLGLDLGADDYLVKPFGVLELVSRVKALLRRSMPEDKKKTIELKALILDLSAHKLIYQDQETKLTNKQFDVIKYFMENEGKTLSREELLSNIWGYDFYGETRTLDVHIKEIRKKLMKLTNKKNIIETIHGVGYEMNLWKGASVFNLLY